MTVDIRRADRRSRTGVDWLDSRHSFSFGPHYDPVNTHFGLLVVSNDDIVRAGGGFDPHPHRDMEIVTWVLDGSLVHQDSTGHSGVIHPGLAQRMSAGRGVVHSEKNDAGREVRFVQMWVRPDTDGTTPGYEQLDVSSSLAAGELVVVASGMAKHAGDRAISIRQENAALHAVRLRPRATVRTPVSPWAHVYVARGSVRLEGTDTGPGDLGEGDAARITAADGQRLMAGPDGAEVLVWEMHATLG